jgi:hypothetical protein
LDLFVVYLTTPFSGSDYVASNEGVINEWWIGNDGEESGCGLHLTYYPIICMEVLRKTTKTSARITGLRTKIWTRDLPNTKQEW